jgi:hypothetical protein
VGWIIFWLIGLFLFGTHPSGVALFGWLFLYFILQLIVMRIKHPHEPWW